MIGDRGLSVEWFGYLQLLIFAGEQGNTWGQWLNFGWLRDKKLRFVAKALPTLLGSIVLFAALVNLFGYSNTEFLVVVVALILWIVSTQAVEKISPSPRSKDASPLKTGGREVSCWKCGSPIVFYPPDDDHLHLQMDTCSRNDSIQRTVKCSKCGKDNIRHWDYYHPLLGFAKVR